METRESAAPGAGRGKQEGLGSALGWLASLEAAPSALGAGARRTPFRRPLLVPIRCLCSHSPLHLSIIHEQAAVVGQLVQVAVSIPNQQIINIANHLQQVGGRSPRRQPLSPTAGPSGEAPGALPALLSGQSVIRGPLLLVLGLAMAVSDGQSCRECGVPVSAWPGRPGPLGRG